MNNLLFFSILLFYLSIWVLCFVVCIIKLKRDARISSWRKKRSSFRIVKEEDNDSFH